MKKIMSFAVTAIMLVCMIVPLTVSADGTILWTDDFSSVKENDWIWDEDTTRFFVDGGKLEGWAEAVVHQSNFLADRGAPRRYKECAWKVECAGLEDGGNEAEQHSISIWFADYISPYADPESIDGTISYSWGYSFERQTLDLSIGFDNDAESFKPAGYPEEGPYKSFPVPADAAPVLDANGGSPFTLGMRIANGKAAFYMNDVKYCEIDAFRGALTATQVGSPLLLFNGGCHCTFDNLVVATPDYNLFNESAAPANNEPANNEPVNNDPAATETRIDTVIVTDTDEEGNVVTRVETEKTVVPAPNTGNGGGGRTATKTGDTIVIVAAVMIAAIGMALVVKKVCIR